MESFIFIPSLRNSFLLGLCFMVCLASLSGQSSLPEPTLWWTTQLSESGIAHLIEQDEVVSVWDNSARELVNFHAVPILSNIQEEGTARSFITQGGMTTFSVYQDALPDQEQSLWSLKHENKLIATASDIRLSNNLDSVEYAFAGITNQWLRLSTHFFSHQSLSNKSCKYYFGEHPDKQEIGFTGVLLEEVVFDRILSKKQRKQVESYLSVKYGIPLLSNGKLEYLNSTGDAYWSASKNHAFRHRPTAVGRDDFWQLYQRQSTNAYEPGLLTIGLGQIRPLNEENTGALEDLSFLVWSDNNADLAVTSTSNVLDRVWEIQKTKPEPFNTSLRLGVRQLKTELETGEKYWLAIDQSGESAFAVQSTEYYSPLPNGNREFLHYEGIQWDVDQSGKDHFTFLKGGDLIVVYDVILPPCEQEQSGQLTFKVYGGTAPYRYQIQSMSINGSVGADELKTIEGLSSGRHLLRITDANGLQVEQEIELFSAEFHAVAAGLDREYQIKQGEPLELELPEPCDDCAYEWRFPDGEIKGGHQVVISQAGNYQLRVSRGDCQSPFDFSVKERQSPFQSVELWGNPSRNGNYVLEIRLWEAQPTTISIFNQQGQLVQEIALPLNHYHKYQGQGLLTGTYQIQVQSNGESITKTLITL